MPMFYLFIFPIEGIRVRVLVLGIRYKACACAFSSFCCYIVGQDCFMVPFPQWAPPTRMGKCSRESGTLPRDPCGSTDSPLAAYLVSTLLCLCSYGPGWRAEELIRLPYLQAGVRASRRAVKPCRRNCHQPSQRVLPVTALSEAFFTGRSRENVPPCFCSCCLWSVTSMTDEHEETVPALLSMSETPVSEGDKARDFRLVERSSREDKGINRAGGKRCKHLWEREGGRDGCERKRTKRRT